MSSFSFSFCSYVFDITVGLNLLKTNPPPFFIIKCSTFTLERQFLQTNNSKLKMSFKKFCLIHDYISLYSCLFSAKSDVNPIGFSLYVIKAFSSFGCF